MYEASCSTHGRPCRTSRGALCHGIAWYRLLCTCLVPSATCVGVCSHVLCTSTQVATQDQFAVWVLRRRAPRLRTPWPQHWAAFACVRMYLWGQMLRRPTKSNAHLRKSALRELRVARFGVHKLAGLAPLQAKQSTCAYFCWVLASVTHGLNAEYLRCKERPLSV